MEKITKEQYEFALNRIEELLPLVTDETPANDKNAIELTLMSDIVESYEKRHFPIGKPSVSELIELSLSEKEMTQKQLATEIGISPSRINDYITGRSEPTLKIAKFTPQEMREYEASKMAYRDIKNSIDTAKQKGIEEGMNQKALDIARNMLADGVDINLIMKYSGLTQEQIENLK